MIKLIILASILSVGYNTNNEVRYHQLAFSSSDPYIIQRCISLDSINSSSEGYVIETIDDIGRCVSLKFFNSNNTYYQSSYFPSIIKYHWTSNGVIQTLHHSNGELFSKDVMIRPNKIEFVLCNSNVIRTKAYFNDQVTKVVEHQNQKLEDVDFFMMYSGCEIKYNKKYRMSF